MIFRDVFGVDFGAFAVVAAALVVLASLYNWLVAWMERNGFMEGYTAMMVVGGVVLTLICMAFIDLQGALLAGMLFIASGTPMIVGSMWRHMQARKAAVDAAVEEVEG